jgi:hypothetical protein
MEGQDIQIEQIRLNTKVATPLVNKKKLSCFQTRPCTYLTFGLGCIFELYLSWFGKSYPKKNETNRDEKKKKKKKKKPNLQHLYFIVFNNDKHFGSRICNKFQIGSVQWEEMQIGMDQATQKSKKQLKKPDLYEEEKIQRKIKTQQRRSYGGWVVRVVCGSGGGGDSAWLVTGSGGPAGIVVAERSMGHWSRRS